MELISNYENSVNAIITEFKQKQVFKNADNGYWIGNSVGEVYDFGDGFTFDFNDVLTDIREDAPKGEIFEWREYLLRIWHINNLAGGVLLSEINYKNWLKRCPRLTKEELNEIEDKWKKLINDIAEIGKSKTNSDNSKTNTK
jgi:hypothetical protein